MKSKFYIIVIISLTTYIKINAQINLVPNPSFEDTVSCPYSLSNVYDCKYWSSYGRSPDYYHTCYSINFPSAGGFQYPRTGNAYVGFYATEYSGLDRREYLGVQLIDSLIIGTKYYVSYYLNMGSGTYATVACNHQDILLSTFQYDSIHLPPINNLAQISQTFVISDTTNWIPIKGSFIADSNYKYLIVGNFYDDLNTDTIHIGNDTNFTHQNSYYFIDDICLSEDSNTCFLAVGINSNLNKEPIHFYPNPNDGTFLIKYKSSYVQQLTTLKLYNILGEESQIEISKQIDGFLVSLKIKNSGVYILVIESNGFQEKQKIIVNY